MAWGFNKMSIRQIFVNLDEGREALEVIKHYVKYKEEYPRPYYDFFLHWSLINPLYNACSSSDYEALRIVDFGEKMETALWNDKIESFKNYYSVDITPKQEFWAHCSNLQTWNENYYDTRLIHTNLAFPL